MQGTAQKPFITTGETSSLGPTPVGIDPTTMPVRTNDGPANGETLEAYIRRLAREEFHKQS